MLQITRKTTLVRIALLFIVLSSSLCLKAADTLYINRDTLTITPVLFQKAAFNVDTVFNAKNAVLDYSVGAPIDLVIINNDTVNHVVRLPNLSGTVNISPSSSASITINSLQQGTYLLYIESDMGYFLGAGAVIRVGISGQKFAWDLWDQDPDLTNDFGNEVISQLPSTYRPTIFTINGVVDHMTPNSGNVVTGNVGDTIYISVVNNGNMDHTLHFHGYHIEIIQSTHQAHSIGWFKDTFPILVKEAMTVRLVPHQPGEFPVHNHNLIATLFNNGYPRGMVTMLMIQE
jgi:DNA-dependent RNA polymerase auxiliary subunit epsilon